MTTHDRFDPDHPAAARLRAGDADREWTADKLRRAHSDGRIDSDELAERIGRCYEARTYGELQRLTADLLGPARRGSRQRLGRGGHRSWRIALAAIAAVWVLAVAIGGRAGHAHPHPPVFAFLVVLAFAFLVTRLVHAVRA